MLNCEKKLWEASSGAWFGCGRSIIALQSKSDTRRIARMRVQCGVVGPSTSFRWSQTSLNTPIKGHAS